jgi:glutamine synthetase
MASALKIFENSEFIQNAFGPEVHKHLVEFYKNEVDLYERTVTRWELNRYLDLI